MMATQESAAEKLKILIVDDEGITLSAALEANNFTVTTAGAVNDALHIIDTQVFDVLLSDLHMPRATVSRLRHAAQLP